MFFRVLWFGLGLGLAIIGCQSIPEDRGSALAASAGNKTVVLGSCNQAPEIGWSVCQMERGGPYPQLRIYFINQGSYMVSDCFNGVLSTGNAAAGQVVEISVDPIVLDMERLGFCLLKVDTIERWGDGRSTSLAGGFVIELFDRGYIVSPPRDLVAFCKKFGRTTAGRTMSENCN